MVGAVSSTAWRESAELTARASYRGDIFEPMQFSARTGLLRDDGRRDDDAARAEQLLDGDAMVSRRQ